MTCEKFVLLKNNLGVLEINPLIERECGYACIIDRHSFRMRNGSKRSRGLNRQC